MTRLKDGLCFCLKGLFCYFIFIMPFIYTFFYLTKLL
nr:MAG TPA_asm: hypothetical protein [Caudoviricetes sp.]